MNDKTRIFLTQADRDEACHLTYCGGDLNLVVRLGATHNPADRYSFFLYNDELMLMATAGSDESTSGRQGRSLKRCLSQGNLSSTPWLPGNYQLLIRNESQHQVMRSDVVLDNEGRFTAQAPYVCEVLSNEYILSGSICLRSKTAWMMGSRLRGVRQLRRVGIERARRADINILRTTERFKELEQNDNFLVICPPGLTDRPLMILMKALLHLDYDTSMVKNCAEFYDVTNSNPYEQLTELFSSWQQEERDTILDLPKCKKRLLCLYNLQPLTDSNGKVVMRYLQQHWQSDYSLMLFGTQSEISAVLEQFPSLNDRFPQENRVHIEQPTCREQIHFFFQQVGYAKVNFSPAAIDKMCRVLTESFHRGIICQWGKQEVARYIREHILQCYCQRLTREAQAGRLEEMSVSVEPDDIDEQPLLTTVNTYEEALQELNAMVGLADIKRSIVTDANRMRFYAQRRQLGLHTTDGTVHHALFTGNPGTGKTTVARLLGRIYHSLGLLSRGEVICLDRTKIVGRYIGETEENMKQILQEARGNVLFVDEAYTLYSGRSENDFGRRAVECLLTVLTQKEPDMLIIFAGYEQEMDQLMSMNPGLVGRFPYKYKFSDYRADELMQIARRLFAQDDYLLTDAAAEQLQRCIHETTVSAGRHFGNARWVEQFVRNGIIPALADRLAASAEPLDVATCQRIEAVDIESAFRQFNAQTIELKPRRTVGFSA